MKQVKIFGQEPAFIVGVVEAGLALFLTMGWLDWNQEQVGVTVACVAAVLGFVVAYVTSTTVYSAFVGLAKAILVLAVTFGLHVTDAQSASLLAFVTLVVGIFLRNSTNSVDTPLSNASPGAKKEALQLYALQAAVQEERQAA